MSTVPCTMSVGTVMSLTRSPGPRLTNHCSSSALSVPVVVPDACALVMCGSIDRPAVAANRRSDQPDFTVSAL